MVSHLYSYVNKNDQAINPPGIIALETQLKDLKSQLDEQADTIERIQQQLAQINNNNNLEPGERFH